MRKILYLFVLFTFQATNFYGNEIDDLKTAEEVNKFLKKTVVAANSNAYLDKKKTDSAQFGKNKFHKIDLDKNGLTDLIIDGEYCFAVVDAGAGKYKFRPIDRGIVFQSRYSLTNILFDKELPLLIVRQYDPKNRKIGGAETEKILVYKFDEFVEYNPNPNDLMIEEIKFAALGCNGNCPVYEITISPDKNAVLNAVKYVKKKGVFKTTIDADNYNQIVQTFNYIDINKIPDNYFTGKSDEPVINVQLKYNGGKIKRFSSYGMDEHFGLNNLLTRLYALPDIQQWN